MNTGSSSEQTENQPRVLVPSNKYRIEFSLKIFIACFLIFLFIILCLLITLLVLCVTGQLGSNRIIVSYSDPARNSSNNLHNINIDRDYLISKSKPFKIDFQNYNKSNLSQNSTIHFAQLSTCGLTYYQNSIYLSRSRRIVNGVEANPHSQPWIVSLRTITSYGTLTEHFCGGSLITEQHVATAAHCLENVSPSTLAVLIGIHNINEITQDNLYLVENFWINEQFTGSYAEYVSNDIAIIKLDKKIQLSDKVQLICLPSADESILEQDALASGWGNTFDGFESQTPQALQTTLLRVINDNPICDLNGSWDMNKVLCALEPSGDPKSNICFGDSGGPLIRQDRNGKWKLYGIASYVLVDRDKFGRIKCLTVRPSYFTNVAKHIDWIIGKVQL